MLRTSNINGLARIRSSRFSIKNGEILSKTGISIKNGEKNGETTSKTGDWKEVMMRRKNIKDRCEKNHFDKCPEVCKTYDAVQTAYDQQGHQLVQLKQSLENEIIIERVKLCR